MMKMMRWLVLGLSFAVCGARAENFVVTNTLASGPGSLADALAVAATNAAGDDVVSFAIPGVPPFVIAASSTLPILKGATRVDGSTQPGFSNVAPAVVVDGSAIPGTGTNGFRAEGSGNVIRGLVVQRFSGAGIYMTSLGGSGQSNRVEGCHLLNNTNYGVVIQQVSNCVVGGWAASNRNVVSGSAQAGIAVSFGIGNLVAGNWVGVSATSSAVLATGSQRVGIEIDNSWGNVIASSPTAAQVLSGNNNNGLRITGGGSNLVHGNFIGCDASALVAVSNNGAGVLIVNTVGNRIGGTGIGQRNFVSGNTGFGFDILAASENVIEGNYIGANAGGFSALPNMTGIRLQDDSSNNLVGGSAAGAGNVISGNTSGGLYVYGVGNRVEGNSIGLGAGGSTILSNGGDGVLLGGGNNLLGGTNLAARNLIGGNGNSGVRLSGVSNLVQGNLIGVDASGNRLPNTYGVSLSYSDGCVLGGISTNARNVISGNGLHGIYVSENAKDSFIQGNYVGLAPNGFSVVSNVADGVRIDGATNITVGGSVAGAGNVIGGNGQQQVNLLPKSRLNIIAGNLVGLAADGVTLRGGGLGYAGVVLNGPDNRVGGLTAAERNVIAGSSSGYGMEIFSSSNNVVQGNYIGLASNGVTAFTNAQYGIYDGGGSVGTVIGGTNPAARNIISGFYASIFVFNAVSNSIIGNYLGLTAAGTLAVTSTQYGILMTAGTFNRIGGTSPGEGNIIYGAQAGVSLSNTNSHHNTVQGNFINLDPSGGIISSNVITGISLVNAQSNLVGGAAAAARNVIFSRVNAIQFDQSNAVGNVAQGNYIGVGPDGYSPRKFPTNAGTGIHVFLTRGGNTIGGTNAGEGNIIAHQAYGIVVFGSNATRTAIFGNTIYSNVWNGAPNIGIDLAPEGVGADGTTANDAVPDADIGPNNLQNFPVLTNAISLPGSTRVQGYLASSSNSKFRIEFFYSDSTNAEGRAYLGATNISTAANGTGTFSVILGGYAATSKYITATATDPNNNTSEFCPGTIKPSPAPDTDGDGMPDYWETPYSLNPSLASDATNHLDADGVNNLAEYLSGTIPNNAASYLRITDLSAGSGLNLVSFPSSQFRNYNFEAASAATNNAPWTTLLTNVLGSGLTLTLGDLVNSTSEFYRIRSIIP